MERLSNGERELVALGAALGSNCVPCIEHHIPLAREAGYSDRQLGEVIRLADHIRQVPARKVLDTALGLLSGQAGEGAAERAGAPSPEVDEPGPPAASEKLEDSLTAAESPGSDGRCCG